MRLADKVAVIVGGGAGIGRACAERFAAEGAAIMLGDVNADDGQTAAKDIAAAGGAVDFVEMDATVADDAERLADETVRHFGRIDVVQNNAYFGGANGVLLGDLTEELWRRTIDTTLHSGFLIARAALPYMQRQGSGTFVFTASSQGLFPSRAFSAYSVAKAGVVMLAKAVACDYGKAGIRSNALCPGVTRTRYARHFIEALEEHYLAHQLVGQVNEADDVASAAVFLASDESRNMQGGVLQLDGGINLRHFASWDVEPLLEPPYRRSRPLAEPS